MQALKKTLFLVLVVALSCEIEDEYSNPDRSEQLGTKIYTTNNVPAALLWSENTNEIIVVGFDGIAAIEAREHVRRGQLCVCSCTRACPQLRGSSGALSS